MKSWLKKKITKAQSKRKASDPPPNTVHGHRESEVTATGSAPPNIAIVSESSQATETHRSTTGVGNTRNDALNYDAISTTTSAVHDKTHSIVESEYEARLETPDVYTNATGGFFSNAHHLVLNNPSMVDSSTKIVHQGGGDKACKAKKLLLKHMIHGAAHDSSARDPPPQCHPGTRIKINERIIAWFYDQMKLELILWIYGPAGVGKSAIVQTFAEALALAQCLGASVFFSRPNGRHNSGSVFITIAYELALRIEEYSVYIGEKLAFDPRLMYASMKEQFRAFIVEPFVEKKVGAGGKAWGILLDGLDELDERDRQREIIQLITTFAHDHPEVPLAWVISSRPEPHITNTFKKQRLIHNCKEEYVPIDSLEGRQDVERYLRGSFKTIQRDSFPHIVAEGWPDDSKIAKLANAASGLFAFADVAVRFIGDLKHADPIARLDDVLSVVDGCRAISSGGQPFALLDALYTRILSGIPSEMWPTTQRVLGTIAASELAFGPDCVKGLSVVFGLPLGKVYAAINDLYSLLDIPLLADVYKRQFRFHHTSFVDFLQDPARSKEFYTPKANAERDLTESMVKVWLDFKKNSAHGPSSGYTDRWLEYASKLHSEGNQPAKMLRNFNFSLFLHIHISLWCSFEERWSTVQRERLEHHWDELLDLLSQLDAGSVCVGLDWIKKEFVKLWFDIWKTHREELTSRGIAREIQLNQLHLESLEEPKPFRSYCIGMPVDAFPVEIWVCESFDEYISYFKYLQQRHPELQVLICGPSGSRFAMFVSEITKGDFQGLPPNSTNLHKLVANHTIAVYHCVPCSDDV